MKNLISFYRKFELGITRNKCLIFSFALIVVFSKIIIGFLFDPLIGQFSNNNQKGVFILSTVLILLSLVNLICQKKLIFLKYMECLLDEQKITTWIISKLNSIDLEYAGSTGSGKWMTILTSDIKFFAGLLPITITNLITGIFSFIGALIFGFITSPLLTAIVISLSLFSSLIPKYLTPKIKYLHYKMQDNDEQLNQNILSIVRNALFFKGNDRIDFASSIFEENFKNYNTSYLNSNKMLVLLQTISEGAGFMFTSCWTMMALWFIHLDILTIGELIGFQVLSSHFTWIFSMLPQLLGQASLEYNSANRINEYIDLLIEPNLYNFPEIDIKYKLEFKGITFRYQNRTSNTLENISMILDNHRNKKILISGESGGGKSTLLGVLAGNLSPLEGKIIIDDKQYDEKILAKLVSYVPQDNVVLNGTLRENIVFDKIISEPQLKDVIKNAGLLELVNELEEGLETQITSDTMLSTGQVQRIGLARAMIKDSFIIIIDEGTSALDKSTEKKITNFIRDTNRIIVSVTHRLKHKDVYTRKYTLINGRLEDNK